MTQEKELSRDFQVAMGLFLYVTIFAFAFAYPFPHPVAWPFVVRLSAQSPLWILAGLGHIGLGLFAALVYLTLRIVWSNVCHVGENEFELPKSCRRVPFVLGTLVITALPPLWRMSQCLTPSLAVIDLVLAGVVCWLLSRGCARYGLYAFAFFLFAVASGVTPVALALMVVAFFLDAVDRWRSSQDELQSEDRADLMEVGASEQICAVFTMVPGFALSAWAYARFMLGGGAGGSVSAALSGWYGLWITDLVARLSSPLAGALVFAVAGVVFCFAIALRLMRIGRDTPEGAQLFLRAAILVMALVTLGFVLRAVDVDTRARLRLIRTYLENVAEDCGATGNAVRWLFTDGRFDGMLERELKRKGLGNVVLLDMLNRPDESVAEKLRKRATGLNEREIFALGGAEVFRAWARENPGRLEDSAWMFGGGVIRKYGKVNEELFGSVFRVAPTAGNAATNDFASLRAAANLRQDALAASVRDELLKASPLKRALCGGVDRQLAEKFDDLVWRCARVASARSAEASAAGRRDEAERFRQEAATLDRANASLAHQGALLEKILPSLQIALTARESLEITIKRADFQLGVVYAREILREDPKDPNANFVLAMDRLEQGEYDDAILPFKKILAMRPDDTTVLNNLAIACLKSGRRDEALSYAEKAHRLAPNVPAIAKTLEQIREAKSETRQQLQRPRGLRAAP